MSSASKSSSELIREVRSHEVAIAELNSLSSEKAVYQRNGALLFRSTVPKTVAAEQKQMESAKAKIQKLTSS